MNIFDYITRKAINIIGSQQYLTIQLDITNDCNLHCRHCYLPQKCSQSISYSEWDMILNQYSVLLKKLKLEPMIMISGGEPLISSNFKPIIENLFLRWSNIKVSILTNGTTIDQRIIDEYKDFQLSFQISLDGPDAERNDFYRGEGAFNAAIRGVRILNENNARVSLQSILSKQTSSCIPEFFSLAKELNARSMNFTRFIPQGRGENLMKNGYDRTLMPNELKNAMEVILSSSVSSGVATNTNRPLFNLIDKSLGGHGLFGFQGIIVDCYGNLKVSSRANYVLGNIIEEGLDNLFLKHPVMKQLRKGRITVCEECSHYKRCGGDRNASFAATGSFFEPDPGCWIINH